MVTSFLELILEMEQIWFIGDVYSIDRVCTKSYMQLSI